MSYNDQWQRDQRDRDLGNMGIATGSSANLQALTYHDAQQRNTQQITDNLYKQFQPQTSNTSHTKSVRVIDVFGETPPAKPIGISSTGVFLVVSGLVGLTRFLISGDLAAAGIAAGTTAGALFALRTLLRTRLAKLVGIFVATMAIAAFVIFYFAIKVVLALAMPALVIYLVWRESGPETALWTAGAFLGLATLIFGVYWLDEKYMRFSATPKGMRFVRRMRLIRFSVVFGALGTGAWWLWSAL